MELTEKNSASTGHNPGNVHAYRRRKNDKRIIENPLAHLTDEELKADVRQFAETWLPGVDQEKVLRAARVAKDVRTYDDVARDENPSAGNDLDVRLTTEEKHALKAEKDAIFSQRGMDIVILTVSLAAFLQGFVQSSINGASLYDYLFIQDNQKDLSWRLGAANSSPWFSAALTWIQLLGVRIINGVGMGIKAVSTPILASETAVGYWRGTSILAWQLLQALRDIYLVYKSIQLEEYTDEFDLENQADHVPRGFFAHLAHYASQYRQLFTVRRLRNALISSSTVALAQQLCGINILAFYSGNLFSTVADGGLPAIRTIDTLGRRKWLTITLPIMSLLMMAAALSTLIDRGNPESSVRMGVVALFVFCPIPFTLASESFPLSHREAGAASAISINLFFAGLLSICYPSIEKALGEGGALGLFSGLNLTAFVLVFLLLEETKRRSLEDLDLVFAVRKRTFVRHQVVEYLPWFFRRYLLGRTQDPKPSLYVDLMWSIPPRRPPPPPSHATTGGSPPQQQQQWPPTTEFWSSRGTVDTAHE
ncbi:putative sugar transporter protein [Eutypa lata UCREL1]|uniref:Putative sugar transporter protein n=1 Tax=Eutypa lata (strain UCR-EL1) TaxID=1287681 RepID=M7SX23_EUTLA|nr:putative sugar transporter protein [Eutypa lata UCREL1]